MVISSISSFFKWHSDLNRYSPLSGGVIGLFTHIFSPQFSSMPTFRAQWETNGGYCGEVSMISAGLIRGMYMSQYDVRALIAPKSKNPQSARHQLLLGENDKHVAEQMHFTYEKWHAEGSSIDFLNWVKTKTQQGHTVTIGLFMNQFYFTENEEKGDDEYDHIVTVTAVTSKHDDHQYHDDDVLHFTDHNLWTGDSPAPQRSYQIPFSEIRKTRSAANLASSPLYSLKLKDNYGMAITGIQDPDKVTLPVRIHPLVDHENEIKEGSKIRPAPIPQKLRVVVSDLTPGMRYTIYQYDCLDHVPSQNFHEESDKAIKKREFIASSSTYTFEETILSDQTIIYRSVPSLLK